MPGQKLHSSIAFCAGSYNPKAALPQQRRWDELIATGQRFDQDWAIEWKDILEMDIFDHAIMPEIVDKLKSEPGGDNTVWTYRLTVITSTSELSHTTATLALKIKHRPRAGGSARRTECHARSCSYT